MGRTATWILETVFESIFLLMTSAAVTLLRSQFVLYVVGRCYDDENVFLFLNSTKCENKTKTRFKPFPQTQCLHSLGFNK